MRKISNMDTDNWKEALENVEFNIRDLDCQCGGGLFGSSGKKCDDLDDDDEIKGLSLDMICYASAKGEDAYKVVDEKCFTFNNCEGLGGTIKTDACVSGDTSSHTFKMTKNSVGSISIKSSENGAKGGNKKEESNESFEETKTSSGNHCGISTCTDDIWNTSIGGDDTCGSKIEYYKSGEGGDLSVKNACTFVAHNFPNECGACYPEKDRMKGYVDGSSMKEFVDRNGVTTFDSLNHCIERVKDSQANGLIPEAVAVIYREENHPTQHLKKTCITMSGDGWSTQKVKGTIDHQTACLDSTKFIKDGCA
jgi:hypothetical protein